MYIETVAHVFLVLGVFGGCTVYPVLGFLFAQGQLTISGLTVLLIFLLHSNPTLYRSSLRWLKGAVRFQLLGLTRPWFLDDGVQQQFILLTHPHGLFTITGCLYAMCTPLPDNTVLLIDKQLYYMSPLTIPMISALTGLEVSYLNHHNIRRLLHAGKSLILFPGGFHEAVGCSDGHDPFYFHMYPYWLRVARDHPTVAVYSVLFYGGSSRYTRQSRRCLQLREYLATYSIPAVLPLGFRFPDRGLSIPYRYVKHDVTADTTPSTIMEAINAILREDVKTGVSGPTAITCRL